ncbi:NADPH-dependent glutamate synthase, glutamine amidotransferase and FMN-binding subunit [Syntrophotalea carbinolica DSM 2380]|uniref:NADPH-dependent glutamate synthase, glutamine amidotransferase and FMN-binding subunit n=1 Tax=Syntrophotalea carbinolica (strain DSM 2380 / NBRC 103641 / GraBd1) TaxID=338963 RepID=Q3A4H9_SYNC1|nr:glutamate synthase large subunit [Syntrophotalea carbinolica]ABA88728.1 NADPH-dependent glutamate synthase, glutamine amidotransferase and FMN-binding subunit [Syntrophotalea carbinolica DSM 2380]
MDFGERYYDGCGFGLLAQIKNQPSHALVEDAVRALARLMHRGAIAADGKTGDGSGLLCSMPRDFMRRVAAEGGVALPEQYAVAMLFLDDEERQLGVFREVCEKNDLRVLHVREVPLETSVLGERALKLLPKIRQAFVVPAALIATRRFEALLYLTRKEVEHQLASDADFYIPSLSSKTVVYKGLVMPTHIRTLYPDLSQEDFRCSFVLFHQRFSTNTLPLWKLAQPMRTLAHNGEINSLQANRFHARHKFNNASSPVFSDEELARLFPLLEEGGSDSASLDNMLEFLLANGIDFFKATRALIPPPRHNVAHMDAHLRSFYEYISTAYEPWDGPAAISLTDGRYVGCILDRNGLRPAKYLITTDDRLLVTSEYGVLDIPPEQIRERGRLQSGEMIAADLQQGQFFTTRDIDRYLMDSQPYSDWLTAHTCYLQEFIEQQFDDLSGYEVAGLTTGQRYFNVTHEIQEIFIRPMLEAGKEPTGSMGDDTPMAAFSKQPRSFCDFFRQRFAQVTNPPIDPYREKAVMSTTVGFGELGNPLLETPERAHRLKSISPILSREIFDVLMSFGDPDHPRYDPSYRVATFATGFDKDLRVSLQDLGERVVRAVLDDGVRTIVLDDRAFDAQTKIIPMALAVGYLNQRLLQARLRHLVSIVAVTGEVVEPHAACVLLGYGAMAIYPWLLYGSGLELCRCRECSRRETRQGLRNLYQALTMGVLKIMSKMGISSVASYCNAALFDIIGLSEEIGAECFPGTAIHLPGLGYAQIEERIAKRHGQVFKHAHLTPIYPLEIGSLYRHNPGGEYHDFASQTILALHRFAHSLERIDYLNFRQRIERREGCYVRDFFTFASANTPIPLEEVEPVEAITRRFDSAAMSLGSISPECHMALAEALHTLGGCSNSGEGGEDPARYRTNRNSKIKQIASGRFGVTPAYLRSAKEIQIKVAQGAKPGEGGQLPGTKVSPLIASLRYTVPGVTLISPPPHHDIYSIEDLAQLIFDLRQVNPKARISVKLVSSDGVGTIACGVAKAYADRVIVSGCDGGTGAAPQTSIKFAGNPWELGLSEAHNSLKASGLRELVELQTDGGLKIGADVVKAAMLGAEFFGFGTALLVMLGCKMLRVCHLNACSVGVATQRDVLREHFVGTVDKVVAYLRNVAEDVREILASLGMRSLDEVIGRSDLLAVIDHPKAADFDFSRVLYRMDGPDRKRLPNLPFDANAFEKEVFKEVLPAIRDPRREVLVERRIQNVNRSFGALISGEVAHYYGNEGLPRNALTFRLKGVAGQSLGAFLVTGLNIFLEGVANDYVGKGMHGGRIIVIPSIYQEGASAVGNTCLYGATGGKLFVAGTAGERFAVRNSGALAVVEGTGDHACEYMTGGTVVILGETGINFGAGMTGGAAFVYDRCKSFMDKLNRELVEARRINVDEDSEGKIYLRKILLSYLNRTASPKAARICDNFHEELAYFWMVTPKDMKAPLNPKEGD